MMNEATGLALRRSPVQQRGVPKWPSSELGTSSGDDFNRR